MIERLGSGPPGAEVWVARPTRSLNWAQTKRFLWICSLVPATSGLLMLWLGAPLVLPFAGLEIAALWGAFYYVAWQGEHREIVYVLPDAVIVEKGRSRPSERHEFERAWVRVELERPTSGWYPSRLWLRAGGRTVALGTFLTEAERTRFAQILINLIDKSR